MSMLNQFEENQRQFHQKLQDKFPENSGKLILDGIVCPEEYGIADNLKILWVLKESYANSKNSLLNDLRKKRSNGEKSDHKKTMFRRMRAVQYALQNNIDNYEDVKNRDLLEQCKSWRKVAYINIQKFKAKSRSKDINIVRAYKEHKALLLEQISYCSPDLVIFVCGKSTYNLIKADLINKMGFGSSSFAFFHMPHPSFVGNGKSSLNDELYFETVLKKFEKIRTEKKDNYYLGNEGGSEN